MFRLLTFFTRFRDSLLLVGLLLVALYLIVRANDHQRHVMGDAMLATSGQMQEMGIGISEYLTLAEENQKLMSQNIDLRQQLEAAEQQLANFIGQIEMDSLQLRRMDSLLQSETDTFTYIPARVIKNSTHKSYNYLIINKGTQDGIKKDRGVVSSEGIVGRVIRVVDHYSLVQSALNLDFELMVRAVAPSSVDTVGPVGFYEWSGRNTSRANMAYVSETVPLGNNYDIVTTGNSIVFPPGISVGSIKEFEKRNASGFYRVDVELSTDFTNLRNVYVLSAPYREIIDSLEVGLPQE
ncbi:MAG: rod shape-determining protein MreC [Bacteroidota bacterium]